MTDDESLLDELSGEERPQNPGHGRRAKKPLAEAPAPTRGRRRADVPRRSFLRTVLPALLVVVVLGAVAAGGVVGYGWVTDNVTFAGEESDYSGSGTGEATITVDQGDTGGDIAKKLVAAGVIKSTGSFTTLFSNHPDASSISPGTYRLKKQMSSEAALKLLLDPSSLAGVRVTVAEGQRMSAIFEKLSEATGIPVADFEAAAKDYTALGIPENPAGSAEGYLWPGTYDVPEDATAQEVLTMMASRMTSELDKRGVPAEDRHTVLTIASIAEKEARSPDDYGRVVRTIDNRLAGVGEAGGTPMKLQLDSTVAYVSGKNTVSTTPQERATDSPYNTYLHPGLPIGPISNPGAETIDAALNPPEGAWLYWVTVNTDTGETVFSETKAEHDAAVEKWRQWARDKNGG